MMVKIRCAWCKVIQGEKEMDVPEGFEGNTTDTICVPCKVKHFGLKKGSDHADNREAARRPEGIPRQQ
jgi:hypothetical protein